ncbi:ferrichrome ABC transporter [Corynebacterium atypicum]|uniref:Ferrichrome ABC transporter n=1 Tax=Corynebacterium atypicum TaxID=191610 RepID=A0ABM5QL43_9CORY|nr:iron ABC transporter permease [Corynebacterium atypicum]AIG63458.1 ferrichrome ABC transporter [Corynebacterium atypicum]
MSDPAPSRLELRERAWYRAAVFAVLIAVLVASLLLGISVGSIRLSVPEIVTSIFGPDTFEWHRVVWDIRLPRVLIGALVGMNLAVAGVILQAVMGNPLADPGIIGISSGAGLAGMALLVVFPARQEALPLFAFVGALAAAFIIYVLAWRDGIQPIRVILAGVAVSALCGAGISAVMVLFSDMVQGTLNFMNGALIMKGWAEFRLLWPYSVIGLAFAVVAVSRLDVIVLGDDVARGLGMGVTANRIFLTAIAALLAASAVAAVGLLGFVGLIVPHIMRMVLSTSHRLLVPGSMLAGAGLVVLSDSLARSLFSPLEIPVGIIMSVIGVPFFLFLLRRAL